MGSVLPQVRGGRCCRKEAVGSGQNEVTCTACPFFYDTWRNEGGGLRRGALVGSIAAALGRIFMSYRREETAYLTGWLYDRPAGRYGDGHVFKDVDSIQLGEDFVEQRQRAPPVWWVMRDSNRHFPVCESGDLHG